MFSTKIIVVTILIALAALESKCTHNEGDQNQPPQGQEMGNHHQSGYTQDGKQDSSDPGNYQWSSEVTNDKEHNEGGEMKSPQDGMKNPGEEYRNHQEWGKQRQRRHIHLDIGLHHGHHHHGHHHFLDHYDHHHHSHHPVSDHLTLLEDYFHHHHHHHHHGHGH